MKALVSRHSGRGSERGAGLARHIGYLSRTGAGQDGERPEFFSAVDERVDPAAQTKGWARDRHHFRLIISPEHGDRLRDLPDYVRETMRRVCEDLGEPELNWLAVCHFDTDQPHAHVLLPGRRAGGRDLVIPRGYISYGIRARAQEVAQERLGDLSRHEAERRIWRETLADRFTAFDRRLVALADANLSVPDHLGRADVWSSLMRGRLAYLERLGLARRMGGRYLLAPDLQSQLQRLQTSRDVIRTFNQRRLESRTSVRAAEEGRLAGRVLSAGFHDEIGAEPYVVIALPNGDERYVKLSAGAALPDKGYDLDLTIDAKGIGRLRSPGLDRGR